ncbi:hypothetical protein AVEN_21238-1 [Araneus ventricosus]|uniref:Uncharacterized protein n=1 Tax=Araneus ventricosus TaxID=182803 RepID=A0A4Y2GL54_ARAVE|nr:hypothetical protein AVEN_21238-1 [Araneus ventricosus]
MCPFVFLALWGIALSSKNKTPQLTSPGRALQPHQTFIFFNFEHAHQTGVKAVKNFLPSLGTDFHQDGFLKLISRDLKIAGPYLITISHIAGPEKDLIVSTLQSLWFLNPGGAGEGYLGKFHFANNNLNPFCPDVEKLGCGTDFANHKRTH